MATMEEQSPPAVGGVRVVARIFPQDPAAAAAPTSLFKVAALPDPDSAAAALISFDIHEDHRSASPTGVTPRPRRNDKAEGGHKYRLDGCYLRDHPNHHIFSNEVEPLIRRLADSGTNACVVACGAAPANAHLLMGSQDEPGLLTMAMAQILDFFPPAAVSVSSYQVLQDNRILDLLEPKDHEVIVLEDADGTTHLKGLSRVHVKSIEEFTQLYCGTTNNNNNQHKHPTKSSTHLQSRGHQGLIIYVSRFDQQGRECAVSKMNFLNLAGYADAKQKDKNEGHGRLPYSNKSLYALMNVVQAMNSNQSFVPYRQSKVTRVLQDSLCKTSAAVLIACLDEVSCQDAVSTISLASRSSQVVNKQSYNSCMSDKSFSKPNEDLSVNSKSSSRSFLRPIHQTNSVLDKHCRSKFNSSAGKACDTRIANMRSKKMMHSAKKHGWPLSTSVKMKQKNTSPTVSAITARKLFCPSTNLSKENGTAVMSTAVKQAEGCDKTKNVVNVVPSEMQETVSCSKHELVSSSMQEEDCASSDFHTEQAFTNLGEICSSDVHDKLVGETAVNTTQPSIKWSDKLREISNSLKLLSTQPINIDTQKSDVKYLSEINRNTPEPKTPTHSLEQAEDPKDIFKTRSAGIKKSLVHECLTFLNSANKEQLKSLKGIGEKRADHILNLREGSPELFKGIDDLREIIGMNSKEIKKMMSGIIDS